MFGEGILGTAEEALVGMQVDRMMSMSVKPWRWMIVRWDATPAAKERELRNAEAYSGRPGASTGLSHVRRLPLDGPTARPTNITYE